MGGERLYAEMELHHWWEYGDEKTGVNQLNEFRSLIP